MSTTTINKFNELLVDHISTRREFLLSTKPINFFHASNGVFEIRKNEIGTFCIKINQQSNANKEEFYPFMKLNLPKIPKEELFKIQKFFYAVCDIYGPNEAMVHIYWDKVNKKYVTVALEQRVSAAHVSYKRNKEYELNDDMLLVMDIHSHDTMSAFFSGTDNRDEKETRLFGVIGRVLSPTMDMKFRYGVANKFVDLDIKDIFAESVKFYRDVEFPSEWLDKLSADYNSSYSFDKKSYYFKEKEKNLSEKDNVEIKNAETHQEKNTLDSKSTVSEKIEIDIKPKDNEVEKINKEDKIKITKNKKSWVRKIIDLFK